MPSLRIMLWWDTEDYINPESDDALLLLLQEFKKRELPAVWKLVGEKARVLRARGRRDILDLLADPLFEIGYHTDFHSAHPTIAEYTEKLDWEAGVSEVLARETDGLNAVREITGKPVLCYGQPGASYTPHIYEALRVWGIPSYLGGAVSLGLPDRPCYILGRLSIAWMGEAGASFPARRGEEAIRLAQEEVSRHLAQPPAGRLISEGNHPNEWSLAEWWDEVNFLNGAMPPREAWRPAQLHSREQVQALAQLFGDYLDWLVAQGVQPLSLSDAFRLYHPGDGVLDRDSAQLVAARWVQGDISFYDDDKRGKSFSAAQLLYGLCQSLTHRRETVNLPEVDPPMQALPTAPMTSFPSTEAVREAARALAGWVHASGALPPAVLMGQERVALADFATVAAASLMGQQARRSPVRLVPAEMVRSYGQQLGPWSIHRPDFTGENLAQLTRLLAWTLKPALLGE